MSASTTTRFGPALIATLLLCAGGAARAQMVADGATRTITTTTAYIGDVTVGTNGSSTLLQILSGGRLTNSAAGYIGLNVSAVDNTVRVSDANSRWHMPSDLAIGYFGSRNTLAVTLGGWVANGGGVIGVNDGANLNEVTVISPNSRWDNSSDLYIGFAGAANKLTVSVGGRVANGNGYIGFAADQNQVIVTDPNSLWTNSSSLFVGYFGSGGGLHVANGGRVANNNGYLGFGATANNNQVSVMGTGSLWTNNGPLTVGQSGSGNTLLISDGGRVANNAGTIGSAASANNNQVSVLGTGSLWTNSGSLSVGNSGSANTLLVGSGGRVVNDIGSIGSANNQVTVSGADSLWTNRGNLLVDGSANTLFVSGGGRVADIVGYLGNSEGASNNKVTVTGLNSLWTNSSEMFIGFQGSANALLITDGGRVATGPGSIGYHPTANNNQVAVNGSGSLLTNSTGLYVGYSGSGNTLLVTNGGRAVNRFSYIGFHPTANNNQVSVNGSGSLLTNSTGLYVGYSGSANSLLIANGGLVQALNATMGSSTNSIGNVIHFDNGTLTVPSGLLINSNNTVTGSGTINGPVTSYGTIAPGTSIGKIGLDTPPALRGQIIMEISKSGATLTNDQIQVTGDLIYGGRLTITRFGPEPLVAGDRFQLFSATGGYSGEFASITLPPLAAGLYWTNNLLADGSIVVVNPTPLTISGLTQSGPNLIFIVTGGLPNRPWVQLSSTNVALPLLNWMFYRSGNFDSLGNATLTNAINFGESRRFFVITIAEDP